MTNPLTLSSNSIANKEAFDVIVIGSGMGGLTVASLLAQFASKRVLVLEKHFKAGGFTHTFRRHDWEWDVGLHYVGGMEDRSLTRSFMDYVTGGIAWEKIQDPFEHFLFPDLQLDVSSDQQAYVGELKRCFPDEARAIDRYFRDLKAVQNWSSRWFASKQTPRLIGTLLCAIGGSKGLQTTQEYLDRNIKSQQLKGLLSAQWGDYGLPPKLSPFAIHAGVTGDYLRGAWYPTEGSAAIARGAIGQIEKSGGECRVNHEVTEILIENRRAIGVRCLHKGERIEFLADYIVSNAGAIKTLSQLLPPQVIPKGLPILSKDAVVPTAVTLYLGLSASPATRGFSPGNYWISDSFDHNANYDRRDRIVEGEIHHAYLSFPSMRTSKSVSHVAEIICFADFQSWARWQGSTWRKRGTEYEAQKELVGEAILDFVENRIPGLRSLVQYKELSTPLTVSSLANHHRGAIYGYPASVKRYRDRLFHAKTAIPRLFLTGSDVGSVGINGAMMGGVMATSAILGPLGFPRLLLASRRRK